MIAYSGSYSVTGIQCTIQILEVDMDLLKSTSEGLTWPANIPRPEGVIIWWVWLSAFHAGLYFAESHTSLSYKYGDPHGLEQLKTLLRKLARLARLEPC